MANYDDMVKVTNYKENEAWATKILPFADSCHVIGDS